MPPLTEIYVDDVTAVDVKDATFGRFLLATNMPPTRRLTVMRCDWSDHFQQRLAVVGLEGDDAGKVFVGANQLYHTALDVTSETRLVLQEPGVRPPVAPKVGSVYLVEDQAGQSVVAIAAASEEIIGYIVIAGEAKGTLVTPRNAREIGKLTVAPARTES